MTSRAFKHILHFMYATGFLFIAVVGFTGLPYYTLPVGQRPHSDLHTVFKPGGLWGHGLGVVGSAMIIALLFYSARKRNKLGLRFGRLNRWLDVHIFFGVMGPLLITLHTAMKFNGIVSISYFSMVLVALSGVFGRYLYMQIPRDTRGRVMDLKDSRKLYTEIEDRLRDEHALPPACLGAVREFAAVSTTDDKSGPGTIMSTLWHDLTLRRRAKALRNTIYREAPALPAAEIKDIIKLARTQSVLQRRIALMETMTRMLHYWHVFHKPFAYIMIAIMIIHVGVVVAFGYTWVF